MISGIRDAGPRALLLEFETLDQVLAHHQQLRREPLPGQLEAVAAARTILLRFTARASLRRARTHLDALELGEFSAAETRPVELDVIYDGEDLPELAAHLEMSVDALINWHSSTDWTGAFGGFAPGFTYCVPQAPGEGEQSTENPALNVPRRSSPRTAVPAGAVALAGEFSAVYPRVSPGGWQLIGHTPTPMWDLSREDRGESPALVRPGDSVRYRPVPARAVTTGPTAQDGEPQSSRSEDSERDLHQHDVALTVLHPGLQTLIQDLGRSGLSDLGVSRAGVADEAAARQVNRLVGNAGQAAVLEALHGGLSLRAETTAVLAVAGAQVPLEILDAEGVPRDAPLAAPFALTAGETLTLGAPERGLRSVIGLRGGVAATPVLGSVSADTMSGLGPPPLDSGDRLRIAGAPIGAVSAPEPSADLQDSSRDDAAAPNQTRLRFTYGPRADWFSDEEAARLAAQPWIVTQSSNRIGIRLDVPEQAASAGSSDPAPTGPDAPASTSPDDAAPRPLRRLKNGELPSEGVVRGSLQMPPAGTPVLFLNDHPVTGGYPVIGVVIDEDLSLAAQLAPGDQLHLVPVDPDTLLPAPQTPAPQTPAPQTPAPQTHAPSTATPDA